MAGDEACPGHVVLTSAPARAHLLWETTRLVRPACPGASLGGSRVPKSHLERLSGSGVLYFSLSFLNHGKIHITSNLPS